MLYKETVDTKTLDLIRRLLYDEHLRGFVLVGGTALSLQVGHRISIDIDLFSNKPFDSVNLGTHLSSKYAVDGMKTLLNGIFCFIDDIKVDLISHQYPWVDSFVNIDGVRMASLREISAMKLNAIVQNGSRLKDFVDIYVLLRYLSFNQMYSDYQIKYPAANRTVVQNAVLFHDEIKPAKIDYITKDLRLVDVFQTLRDAVMKPDSLFGGNLRA